MSDWIAERIEHLRGQMMLHSCLYYELDLNIMSDATFDALAKELADLQDIHPDASDSVEYQREAFQGWTGGGGSHLPIRDPEVIATALAHYEEQATEHHFFAEGGDQP